VLLIVLIVLLVTLGLDTGVGSPAASSEQWTRTRLTIVRLNPLEVVGRGFKAGERVVVSVGPRRRAVTAGPRGRFKVRFNRALCIGPTVLAVGSKGSRAAINLPKTVCAEP
jgi:hypothetical protein